MADSFNTDFSTICATSEIDNPDNVPSHDNPTDTEIIPLIQNSILNALII